VTIYNFGSPDLIEQERELLFKRNRSRQQVFEQAQTINKKVKSNSSR
jgi:hypothetical protein